MIFNILTVDNQEKLKNLSKMKKSFFSLKKEDISLLHYSEVKKDMFHVVFHFRDEYLLGTKKIGNQTTVPFSEYINLFFFSNSSFCLIEETNDVYFAEIKNYINSKANSTIQNYKLNKDNIYSITKYIDGFIKKVEYSNDGEDFEKDFTSFEEFSALNESCDIDYVSISNGEHFISLYRNGRISISNSDEDYLINFTKDIVDELEKSRS
ncbi:hypothetical protein [Bacillus badius]|uniref:Uncharacterized protein n=1 Tax=Bacillus badius TaxID=1455 RepID=A0ABR5B190_BACBA|nr:hypothetical protein [Bacillus badius]KIL80758.1 hypothetical protein SD77_0606 [Bacillus badius]MED4715314.1 hypothetical protein [Bacillus badius]